MDNAGYNRQIVLMAMTGVITTTISPIVMS